MATGHKSRILVTGATGTVGSDVMRQLQSAGHDPIAGQRNRPGPHVIDPDVALVDFERGRVPHGPFDAIFLMRPPHLTDPALFRAFLDRYARTTRIVFLSVQGADTKSYLPHAKIEQVVTEMGFVHCFVRPGYFMDNLVTTLWPEMERERRIYLPAGRLHLDWVSARDVAALAVAALLGETDAPALNAVGETRAGFETACARIREVTGAPIRYQPASLPGFILHSRRNGMDWPFIMVMLLLHYLPRFTREKGTTRGDIAHVLGRAPESLDAFLHRMSYRFHELA